MPNSNKKCNYIPQKTYDMILKCIPIVSVEALIVIDDALLFMRRNNEPARGEWWFPGGRIRKGESPKETLHRKIKEEIGLEISSHKFINVYSRVFHERLDLTIAYLCRCKKGRIKLNTEHSEYRLFSKNPNSLHPYLIETIQDSKWSK